jgi:tetratricopeptide (TPR) repeat protein
MWRKLNFFKIIGVFALACLFNVLAAQTIDDAKTLYNEGGTAMQQGDLELAISKFVECNSICSTLYEEEEDEEAEELMYSVQQNIPKLYYQMSAEKLQAGQIDAGIELALKAKESGEEYGDSDIVEKVDNLLPQVYYKLGVNLYKEKNYDGALAALDKAIVMNPNYSNAYYIKVVIYKGQDDDEKMIEASKKGIEAARAENNSKTEEKITSLAGAHFLKKGNEAKESTNYDEATKLLNISAEFDPENPTTYFLLAVIYNSQQEWDKAIASANEGLKYEEASNMARFYYELGNAEFGKGDKTAACEAYSKAATGDYLEHANYQMEHVVKCNE